MYFIFNELKRAVPADRPRPLSSVVLEPLVGAKWAKVVMHEIVANEKHVFDLVKLFISMFLCTKIS